MAKSKTLFSINFKFSAFIGGLLFGLLLLVTLIVRDQLRVDLGREVTERAATVARNLAAPAAEAIPLGDDLICAQLVSLATEEPVADEGLISQFLKDLFASSDGGHKNEGIVKAIIVNASGSVVAESGKRMDEIAGKQYADPQGLKTVEGEPYPLFPDERGRMTYDLRLPLVQSDKALGDLHLYLRSAVITDAVRRATTRLVAIMLVSLLLGVAVLSYLVRVLMRPIGSLVEGVNAVAAGNFSKQIKISPKDELGELVDAYNGMAKNLQEKEAVQEALAKYTSKDLVNQMLTDKSKLELGGQRVHASIYFSVMRGLAALAGTMEPEKFVGIMNEYLEIETDIIMKNGGSIDKFIGDEVMALWGLKGEDVAEQAYLCVKAGVEVQEAIAAHNAKRDLRGDPIFECSIGINTGEVVSGNMGSSVKMDNTVLGGNVNLAARLGLVAARGSQTIISHATYSQVADRFKIDKLAPMPLKGIKEPVPLYWPRKIVS